MPEASIVLSPLPAHGRYQKVTASTLDTDGPSQTRSQSPANRDTLSIRLDEALRLAQGQIPERPSGSAASQAHRPPTEPLCDCCNDQTYQQHQISVQRITKSLKLLACWGCGPIGVIIGTLSFVATIVFGYYALKLANWTATKDYIEHCQADLNIGLATEACQNAAHQQLPPPPFYDYHSLLNSTLSRRNTRNAMLFRTIDSHLQSNSYVWLYAALISMLCWVMLFAAWKIVARLRAAPRRAESGWSIQDEILCFVGYRAKRLRSTSPEIDTESFAESPVVSIDDTLASAETEDRETHELRLRPKPRIELQSDLETWQDRLEEKCREAQINPPVFQIVSDRRGGRTAWSSTVTIQGQNVSARYWYDGGFVHKAKEDAAEMALKHLAGSSINPPTQSRSGW